MPIISVPYAYKVYAGVFMGESALEAFKDFPGRRFRILGWLRHHSRSVPGFFDSVVVLTSLGALSV